MGNRKKLIKKPAGVNRGCSEELRVKEIYFSILFLMFGKTREY